MFLVSPDSCASENCRRELAKASEQGKRIAAVCVRATDPSAAPPQVAAIQWVPTPGVLDDAFEQHVSALDALLRTDLDLLRTQMLVHERAKAWDLSGRRPSPLLRGEELRAADAWLVRADTGVEPKPTPLQRSFIEESERREGRRRRRVVIGSLAVATVAIVLMVFALIQRSTAVSQRKSASSRELAAQSLLQVDTDPELSLLLALESANVRHTPETLAALHRSLGADHLRRLLPDAGGLRSRASRGVTTAS